MDAIDQLTQSLQNNESAQIFRDKLAEQSSGFSQGLFDTAQTGSAIGKEFSTTLFDMVQEHNATEPTGITPSTNYGAVNINRSSTVNPGEVLGSFIESVDAKQKVADAEKYKLLTGQSDNIHQTVIAMQEAGVAFNLMVEVRNKLVESYQELMRTQV